MLILGDSGSHEDFIKDYATHAMPLTHLTKKDVDFVFGPEELQAMDSFKYLLIHSPALQALDYKSDGQIILEVNSSWIAVGFILSQVREDSWEHPSHFGSISWNERKSQHLQAKVKLYSLFRSLRAYRLYLVGALNLIICTDASYLKGMLNNLDI